MTARRTPLKMQRIRRVFLPEGRRDERRKCRVDLATQEQGSVFTVIFTPGGGLNPAPSGATVIHTHSHRPYRQHARGTRCDAEKGMDAYATAVKIAGVKSD